MNTCKVIPGALTFGLLLFSASTFAGGMRCGMHVITDGGRNGPGKYEVLKKCGEPAERYGNTRIYDKRGQPKKVLIFDDRGLLVNIKS